MKTVNDNISKINEISRLEKNWNGNGADKFDHSIILKCKDLIPEFTVQPDIYPTATGCIQLEWYDDCGNYIELEIEANKCNTIYYHINNEQKMSSVSTKTIASTINKLINEFCTISYQKNGYTFSSKPIEINGQKRYHMSTRPHMSDKDYDSIKYRLEKLGGHWRERFGGFIYQYNPIKKLMDESTWQEIEQSDYIKWKIERQFYPTPKTIAHRMFTMCEIGPTHTILEPSIGTGALVEEVQNKNNVIGVEIDNDMAISLTEKGYNIINMPFEDAVAQNKIPKVDRVIMNPPFSKQRDIKHIMLAYDLLEEGGILTAIMSENDLYYDNDTTRQFNKFLIDHNATIEEVPMRSFEESGTLIDTVIIKIKK